VQNPHSIKLLIVDKEPSVRVELTELCRGVADLQVLGEAESGRAAIDAAESLAPDLLLIEVALPDMSGFDLLRNLGNDAGRLGIMTSHQPDFAKQAIAEGAVDYLIKPVNPDRFARAIARVRQRHSLEELAESQLKRQMLRLLGRQPKFLVGERQHRLYPLDIEKIDYIEADGNYVTIRTGDAEYISRKLRQAPGGRTRRFRLRSNRSIHTSEYPRGSFCRTYRPWSTRFYLVLRYLSTFEQNIPGNHFTDLAVAPLSGRIGF